MTASRTENRPIPRFVPHRSTLPGRMRGMRGALQPLWILLLADCAGGQVRPDPTLERILREGRENSQVMQHLEEMVHRFGPRLTGSDSLAAACEWARAKFEQFGCRNARLEEWGTFPVGFRRGPWWGKADLGGETFDLTCGTMAWTAGTAGPRTARAVLGPSKPEEIDRGKLKGAWVLDRAPPRDTALREKIFEAEPAGLVRAARGELIVTGGNPKIQWEKLPARVIVQVVRSQFDRIAAAVREGRDVRLTFDIRNEFTKGPIPLHNVIAEIPGAERPDECVIVGGHIDSWDGAQGAQDNGTGVATTLEAARILCAAAARPKRTIRFLLWSGEEQGLLGSRGWIEKHREELPKISAVFVHDGGTNAIVGIFATRAMRPHFAKVFAAVPPLESHWLLAADLSGRLVVDDVPPDSPEARCGLEKDDRIVKVDGADVADRESLLRAIEGRKTAVRLTVKRGESEVEREAPWEPARFRIREREHLPMGIGSDHDSFLREGVPGFFWVQRGRANYNFVHHTQHDRLEHVVPEYQRHSALVVALAAWGVANLDELLPREGMLGPKPRRLGIHPADAEDWTIVELTPDGPAARAGLRIGDRIVKIGRVDVTDYETFRRAMREAEKTTVVRVLRDGKELEIPVTFDE